VSERSCANFTDWTGAGLNADELKTGCNEVLPADWLKTLKDGSEITIAFAVTFDQSDTKENALAFQTTTYPANVLNAPVTCTPAYSYLAIGESVTLRATDGTPPHTWENLYPAWTRMSVAGNSAAITVKTSIKHLVGVKALDSIGDWSMSFI